MQQANQTRIRNEEKTGSGHKFSMSNLCLLNRFFVVGYHLLMQIAVHIFVDFLQLLEVFAQNLQLLNCDGSGF